jgi:sulfate/thiosulfate transport system permease protein
MKPNSEQSSSAADVITAGGKRTVSNRSKDSQSVPTSRSRKVHWARVGLISLVVTYVSLLVLVPVVALFPKALENGVEAVWQAITQGDALFALRLSLLLAIGAVMVNAIMGVIVALVMVRQDFWGKRFVNAIINLPFVLSPVIVGFMFLLLFGRNGWFAPITDFVGLKIVFSWPGMLLATIFVSLPFVARELIPVLEELGTDNEQVAYTLGASRWQAFWRVTLPPLLPALFYGVILTFARSMGEFGAVMVVGGAVSGLTETSTLYIFRSLDDRQYVAGYSSALLLALISFAVLTVLEITKHKEAQP